MTWEKAWLRESAHIDDTVTIPRELLQRLLDHGYELAGQWEWMRGSIPRYQREIHELDETIRQVEQLLKEEDP